MTKVEKVIKSKKKKTTFFTTVLLLILKRQDLYNIFYLRDCAKYGLEPEPAQKVGNGSGINSFDSTTLGRS
jgi:hypothetical protein